MVVTQSFARGAVRAAVEKHTEAHAVFMARLRATGMTAPGTLRGFREFFRRHVSIHEKDAFLIAYGMVRRRSGAVTAFHPSFERVGAGWNMRIYFLRIAVSPGRTDSVDQGTLPALISGHALERMIQRTEEIQWPVVRDYLAGATLYMNAVAATYLASGCHQCAIPAERGLLVGQVSGSSLQLRTFLPDTQLGARWQSLYDDLKRFETEYGQDLRLAAISPGTDVLGSFDGLLRGHRHGWLRKPYVPGEDTAEDAWRSKDM